MVKLTPDLIQNSMQYINPVNDRELDLRGYKIPEIENLGATLDQFDTIDFSDNDIRKLDGFPYLKRLKSLLLNNNRIVRIGEQLEDHIPNLETLILTGNHLEELTDIDSLSALSRLTSLSLLRNPITNKPHYRLYIIHRLPQLRLLDFSKIKQKERDESRALFKSRKGKEIQRELTKRARIFIPGAMLDEKKPAMSEAEVKRIRQAIAKAASLEEVERLQQQLQAGLLPGDADQNGHEVEYEEQMQVENGTK